MIFAVVAQNLRPSLSNLETAQVELVLLCQQCWLPEPDSRPKAHNLIADFDKLCKQSDVHVRQALF